MRFPSALNQTTFELIESQFQPLNYLLCLVSFIFGLTCRILDEYGLCESWCSLSGSIAGNDSDQVLGSLTDSIDSEGPGLPRTLCGPGPVLGTSNGLKNRAKKHWSELKSREFKVLG